MSNYNYVALLGNLTRETQLSYTPKQTAVCEFGLAVNTRYGDNEETCFVDVRVYGKRAESCNKYLDKGSLVLVTGRLTFEQWEGKDGSKHSRHRIIAQSVEFMPNGKKDREPGQEG